MSNGNKPFKKPTFSFEFSDEFDAKRFYSFAAHTRASNVQYPYAVDGSGKKNPKKVLVTGIGSVVDDVYLQSVLVAEAEKLGGHYIFRAN